MRPPGMAGTELRYLMANGLKSNEDELNHFISCDEGGIKPSIADVVIVSLTTFTDLPHPVLGEAEGRARGPNASI
ncbi:hypothetical protein EVAR_83397_1 [Eumeta japonica]|uniref:Uncharacterized protein n=1 Tax=Eumeta variegata TaxID=151549 RepID=A0A4C1TZ40_EUMVA|nr:hypothetical protein EVAR_83397_1 [Eumeta japonica]